MRKRLTLGALVAAGLLLAAGCTETNRTFQPSTGATIDFLAPSNAAAGGGDFTLTVNGRFFTDKTVVRWNASDRATTFVSSAQITAVIKAADIATPGQVSVNTFTPQPRSDLNGDSNTVIFRINAAPNPVPTINSISPNRATAGGPDFTMTITGSDFLSGSGGSVVQWNRGASQTNLTPSATSATQISVTILASLIATAGSAVVTVSNPPAPNGGGGGGTSPGGITFTIDAGPAAGKGGSTDSPALSADGRYVAFVSEQGGHAQVFVRDTCEGAPESCEEKTTLVSVSLNGDAAQGDSRAPAISADGRYVAFESSAKDLAESLPEGRQVFLRDSCAGQAPNCKPSTTLISTDASGALVGNDNVSPAISASGRFVAFVSVTPSRDGRGPAPYGAGRGFRQVFVRDTCLGQPAQAGAPDCTPRTTRISLHPGDGSGESAPLKPTVSGDGQKVALPGPVANIFTRSVAIEDRAFLALTDSPR